MQYLQFQLLVELYRRISPIFKSPEIVFMDISSKTNYTKIMLWHTIRLLSSSHAIKISVYYLWSIHKLIPIYIYRVNVASFHPLEFKVVHITGGILKG